MSWKDTTPVLSGPRIGPEKLYAVLGLTVLTRRGPGKEHFCVGNLRFAMRFYAITRQVGGETWLRLCEQFVSPPLESAGAAGLLVTGTDELWTKLEEPLVRSAEGPPFFAGELAEVVHGPGPNFGQWSPIRVVGAGGNPGSYRLRPLDAAEGDESRDVDNVPVWFIRKLDSQPVAPAVGSDSSSLDLAVGRPAQASSEKSRERAASNAVDGNPNTRWTSVYEDNQWLAVDLGSECLLTHVEVRWEAAFAASYLVQGSSDNQAWFTLASETGCNGWVVTHLPEGSTARWLRIYGQKRATSYGFSVWELRARGPRAAEAEAAGEPDGLDPAAVWACA